MSNATRPVVLVVEDESDVAETYERWLDEYEVRRAESGDAALEAVDETVDVVLLDRMLPGLSGADVLAEIRARDLDCRVAMVTAVDPGFDVIEMGFDEYVTKPPSRDELLGTVEQLIDRASLDDDLQEYYSLVARRAALQSAFTEARLEDNEEYAELVERIETHGAAVDDVMGDMSSDADFVGAVREISGESETRDTVDGSGELESTDESEMTDSTE